VLLEELAALLVFEAVGSVDEIGFEAHHDEGHAEILRQDAGREGGGIGPPGGGSPAFDGRGFVDSEYFVVSVFSLLLLLLLLLIVLLLLLLAPLHRRGPTTVTLGQVSHQPRFPSNFFLVFLHLALAPSSSSFLPTSRLGKHGFQNPYPPLQRCFTRPWSCHIHPNHTYSALQGFRSGSSIPFPFRLLLRLRAPVAIIAPLLLVTAIVLCGIKCHL
jgi:hypothetical protein